MNTFLRAAALTVVLVGSSGIPFLGSSSRSHPRHLGPQRRPVEIHSGPSAKKRNADLRRRGPGCQSDRQGYRQRREANQR